MFFTRKPKLRKSFDPIIIEGKDKDSGNRINVRIADSGDSPAHVDYIQTISVSLEINNKKIGDQLDIHELFSRLDQTGKLPLFTCTCGVFGCGGHFIEVYYKDSKIKLKNLYPAIDLFNEGLKTELNYEFSIEIWINLLGNIIEIIEFLVQSLELKTLIVGVTGINLVENLNTYKVNYRNFKYENNVLECESYPTSTIYFKSVDTGELQELPTFLKILTRLILILAFPIGWIYLVYSLIKYIRNLNAFGKLEYKG